LNSAAALLLREKGILFGWASLAVLSTVGGQWIGGINSAGGAAFFLGKTNSNARSTSSSAPRWPP
jgi:hypothetical protein